MTLASDWARCYEVTLELEGGRDLKGALVYSNIPGDPGGPTVAGLALLTSGIVRLDANKDGKLDFDLDGDGDVDEADMLQLRNRPEEHREYFRRNYWLASGADQMPWPHCLLTYDAAVHHGCGPAILIEQRAVGATADGKIGPNTLARVRVAGPGRGADYLRERTSLLRRISDRRRARGERDFFDAWVYRVGRLMRAAWAE